MTYRKPLIVLAVLAAMSTATAFAADPPARPDDHGPGQLDKNGDGVIDRNEAAADPKLAGAFDQIDTDKDGKLSRAELPRHHGKRGQGPRDFALAKLDADKDGRISRDEAKAEPKFAERFDAMDTNKDGFVDRVDFQARAKQHRDQWFAGADTDKDGKLSKAEFDAASAERGPHGRGEHDGKQRLPKPAPAAK